MRCLLLLTSSGGLQKRSYKDTEDDSKTVHFFKYNSVLNECLLGCLFNNEGTVDVFVFCLVEKLNSRSIPANKKAFERVELQNSHLATISILVSLIYIIHPLSFRI